MQLKGRNFLKLMDYTPEEITYLIDLSQEMKEKKSLIRVVKTAEGDIILDDTGKKNGRGAYICKSLECFKKAKKTKALERSLGVSVSEQVYEELEKEMNQIDR